MTQRPDDPSPQALEYDSRSSKRGISRRRAWIAIAVALAAALFVVGNYIWQQTEPSNIYPRTEFSGQTLDRILAKLGAADVTQQYTVADAAQMPYRSVVVNEIYPDYDTTDAAVPIRELMWSGPRSRLTIWFHRVDGIWIAITGIQCHNRVKWQLDKVPTTTTVSAAAGRPKP